MRMRAGYRACGGTGNLYYRRAGILEGVVERRLAADHVLGLGRHTASSMHNLVCVSE
jgi:hypothetical protein